MPRKNFTSEEAQKIGEALGIAWDKFEINERTRLDFFVADGELEEISV